MKKIAKVIKRGEFPDSATENLIFWLSKTSAERIAAGEELRRSTYRLMNGREMPRMLKIARVLKRDR